MSRKFVVEEGDVLAECSKCTRLLPLNAYHKHTGRRYNIKSYCIECGKESYTIEHRREIWNQWAEKTAYKQKRHDSYDPEVDKRKKLKYTYGITLEQYNEILLSQNETCAICPSDNPGSGKIYFSVDHDHSCCPGTKTCGECIRGLLCNSCNNGLGRFKDDPELLIKAAAYVS